MKNITLCELPDPEIAGLETFSPFCLKVHRGLKLQGLTYERRFGRSPAAFSELSPLGKVPILLIDDEVIVDSTTILQRLGVPGNGEAKLWEELADTTLAGFLVAARWACESNWPGVKQSFFGKMPAPLRAFIPGQIRRRVIRGLEAREIWNAGPAACWQKFEAILDQLEERAPKTGYWLGDSITVADIALFAPLHSLRIDLTPWQRELLQQRSTLSDFVDRVQNETVNLSRVRPEVSLPTNFLEISV